MNRRIAVRARHGHSIRRVETVAHPTHVAQTRRFAEAELSAAACAARGVNPRSVDARCGSPCRLPRLATFAAGVLQRHRFRRFPATTTAIDAAELAVRDGERNHADGWGTRASADGGHARPSWYSGFVHSTV